MPASLLISPTGCIAPRRWCIGNMAPIFIHSSWRVSHTWFWLKFRKNASTVCFYEPFHEKLATVTRSEAVTLGQHSWNSGHPASDPYFLEFLPLIRRAGGVRLFPPEISYEWFMPVGGPTGELRGHEIRYLSLLMRRTHRLRKIPVLGFARSLGRLTALKKQFSGLHIFLYRNVWTQWLSFLDQKRKGNNYFYRTMLYIMLLSNDWFFSAIIHRYIARGIGRGIFELRGYHISPSLRALADLAAGLVEALPETDLFSLYMAFHSYLYICAQASADVVIDITKLARIPDYRERTRLQLTSLTGLCLTFADVAERQRYQPFEPLEIDWPEIRRNLDLAALALVRVLDRQRSLDFGNELIAETLHELQTSQSDIGSRAARSIYAAEEFSMTAEMGDRRQSAVGT
jgi:hypothetical protein